MSIIMKVAKDFTESPGTRYAKDGKFSGEEFREKLLKPKYKEALKAKEKLIVNLDGGYGYPTSFLEEAFGGLVREKVDSKDNLLSNIQIISEDDPALVNEIRDYIKKA